MAAGLTPLELGSDIGGSIRIPSHCNGIYGLKPSKGIVPSRGHIPGRPGSLVEVDVNSGGPMARSIDDLRVGLSIIAGPLPEEARGWRLELDAGPAISGISELRVATVAGEGADLLPIAAEVRANLDRFAGRLADTGAQVDAVPLPVPLADGFRSWIDIVGPIVAAGMSDEDFASMVSFEGLLGDDPLTAMGRATISRFRSWLHASDVRQQQRGAWAGLFERYDVVLAPVMPTTAFLHDTQRPMPERTVDVDGQAVPHLTAAAWCGAIGAMLLPVVAMPTGQGESGLPVGVQVIGPFLSDLRLLRIAEIVQAATGIGYVAPPLG